MIAENALALSYILPADVYLLANERALVAELLPVETPEAAPVPEVKEPAVTYTEPAHEPIKQEVPVIPAINSPVAASATPSVTIPAISTPAPAAGWPYNYIGSYQKNFLILVNYPGTDIMDTAHLNALEKTIRLKGMSLDDAAIVNINQYPGHDIRAIGGHFKPQKLLFLGKAAVPGGFNPPPFNQLAKVGKSDALYTYSFNEMMGNKDLTKAFWEQMKML
ncbi:hypothetical protein HQ865_18775 [Mucilaginibacter mali]|uniref:Uncharacterized protein n=1 Tax=Mucilaginibacter mali TaxID=2740462 RepID=A0A7D4QDR0_9SPHI|nr:hypothetical protein [Mucilaginibacter mali]QKJ31724.1 hypothetical protein HQ865_18775 [Mucilaginibacter mali]